MDFNEWGQEYLQEAQQLKDRITDLRERLKTANHRETNELNHRIYVLYSMYMECKQTGLLLQNHGADADTSAAWGA